MNTLTLKSPAKVNLYLRITGRRPGGYHNLATLFHRIGLHDTLTLSKRAASFSFASNADLPLREGNLLFKADALLRVKFPKLPGVHAKLVKRIPIGAGMGGGSSNAAFFLLGMQKLYKLKISRAALMKIGAQAGADVPFFILNCTEAFAAGIGDQLRKSAVPQRRHFLLITDPKPLSTPAVYRQYAQTRLKYASKKSRELFVNDLQPAAIDLRPAIAGKINVLKKCGAECVMVSGSGPTVFAVSSSRSKIAALKRRLPARLSRYAILTRSF